MPWSFPLGPGVSSPRRRWPDLRSKPIDRGDSVELPGRGEGLDSPAHNIDGVAFFGSHDGYIYAIESARQG